MLAFSLVDRAPKVLLNSLFLHRKGDWEFEEWYTRDFGREFSSAERSWGGHELDCGDCCGKSTLTGCIMHASLWKLYAIWPFHWTIFRSSPPPSYLDSEHVIMPSTNTATYIALLSPVHCNIPICKFGVSVAFSSLESSYIKSTPPMTKQAMVLFVPPLGLYDLAKV